MPLLCATVVRKPDFPKHDQPCRLSCLFRGLKTETEWYIGRGSCSKCGIRSPSSTQCRCDVCPWLTCGGNGRNYEIGRRSLPPLFRDDFQSDTCWHLLHFARLLHPDGSSRSPCHTRRQNISARTIPSMTLVLDLSNLLWICSRRFRLLKQLHHARLNNFAVDPPPRGLERLAHEILGQVSFPTPVAGQLTIPVEATIESSAWQRQQGGWDQPHSGV